MRPMGAELFCADGQDKLIFTSRNFAKEPKTNHVIYP